MREFNRMKRYCKSVGLQLLHFTKNGHAVYGDPRVPQHTFTDSAPHAKHISEAHYQSARRTAEEIRSTAQLAEQFVDAHPAYEDSYTFVGVHNECAREGRSCHEVYVPGVRSATGAGGSQSEALEAAREMLTLLLHDMQMRGAPVPNSMSPSAAEAYAKTRAREPVAGFTVRYRGVIAVKTLPRFHVPELTEVEEQLLQNDIRKVWNDEDVGE
jgi:predicted RNase H-like HicB family nuclease